MISRYQTKTMSHLWSDETKYKTWYAVELAFLESYFFHQGQQQQALMQRLQEKARTIDWAQLAIAVDRYDKEVRHDVIAFLHALEDELGDDARFIHIGLTSSDIVDTSFAILLKSAGDTLLNKLKTLIKSLFSKAEQYRGVVCLGRTHGQAAEPTTFGIKLLGHVCEMVRAWTRFRVATIDIAVGKFSGAVGVYAHTDPKIEKTALLKLGLEPETVATQIVARDRHAAYFSNLAILGGSIERLVVEIRLLMHGQVREVYEPFFAHQKGSSAMPHKMNPILSENLTGLMRLMRSYALAAMEDQALWHERDISHSSVERVIAPDATSVMDFALDRLTSVTEGLVVDETRMKDNMTAQGSFMASQAVMLALVKKGLMRQHAYEIVQKAAMTAHGQGFRDRLLDLGVGDSIGEDELRGLLEIGDTVLHEDYLFKRTHELVATMSHN